MGVGVTEISVWNPAGVGGSPIRLHLYVEDSDAFVAQAAEGDTRAVKLFLATGMAALATPLGVSSARAQTVASPVFPAAGADGWSPLFNGKNLDGWKTKEGEALEGKTEAYNGRYKVKDGMLVIDPSVKGDRTIFSTKEFAKDVHIKFEFLPGPGCNNDLFLRGIKFDLVKSNVKNMKEGEWNSLEIIVQGNKIEYKNNGETQRKNDAKTASVGMRWLVGLPMPPIGLVSSIASSRLTAMFSIRWRTWRGCTRSLLPATRWAARHTSPSTARPYPPPSRRPRSPRLGT